MSATRLTVLLLAVAPDAAVLAAAAVSAAA
jgi:hypothetical protein